MSNGLTQQQSGIEIVVKVLTVAVAAWAAISAYEGVNKNIQMQSEQFDRRLEAEEKVRVQQRREELKQRQDEYLKAFFEKKTAILFEVCELASKIARSDDDGQRPKSLKQFEVLYYSKVIMVMDDEINQAMWNFLTECKKQQYQLETVQKLSQTLSFACRQSLHNNYPSAIPILNPNQNQFFHKP